MSLLALSEFVKLLPVSREEKSEQLLDTRQELENMEVELRRLQQEVTRLSPSDTHLHAHNRSHDLVTPPSLCPSPATPSAVIVLCVQRCRALIS